MWFLLLLLADGPDITRYLLLRSQVHEEHLAVPDFPKGLKTGPNRARVLLEVEVDREGRPSRSRIVDGPMYKTHKSAMTAIIGSCFGQSNGPAVRTIQVVFVYRSMPAGTPKEELAPIHRGKYEIEVRPSEDDAAERVDPPDNASRRHPR